MTNPIASARNSGRTPSRDVSEALVEAAERLLERDGPSGLTVRAIATEAGVAPMGVYNHFGDKNGIVDEVLKRGFDALGAEFASIKESDPIAALIEGSRRYRLFALNHRARYSVMFERAVPDYLPSDEALLHAAASFDELVNLVRNAMASGAIVDDEPVEVAQQLWSASHGQVSLELRSMGFAGDVEANHQALSATILRGLATQTKPKVD